MILASFSISYFFATLDPFLHLWDEQFHALVSKNLMQHWLKPTLYETPLLSYDYKDWAANHVWLHKQPLFLWQMTVSQFLFGNTELGLRFPDIIMHTVLTFLIFDIGRIMKNVNVGFLAALFFTFLHFPLELVSGKMGLDHNDFAFMFYVTASFWAYFKFRNHQNIYWAVIVGVFSGCAILVKWLPGLLIYASWFIIHVYENKNLKKITVNSRPIVIGVLATLTVFVPWQIYCYLHFPNEFKYEMLFNSMHVSEALEGHEGNWTFYFTGLNKLYGEGEIVPYLLLIAFLFFIYDRKQLLTDKIVIVTAILFVYTFFSFAKTKMIAFPAIVLPLVIVVLANFISELTELIKNKIVYTSIFAASVIIITFLLFDLNFVMKSHTLGYKPTENGNRYKDILQVQKIKNLNTVIKDKNTVVFNCDGFNIKTMYYTDFIAYEFVPSKNDCKIVEDKGYKIAVLRNKTLPDYIEKDRSILKINF